MHLSSSMSSITESERCKTSYLSAGLVDTVFGYQKEIIQLRQEQGLVIAKGSGVIKQNERLKQQKLKNTERIKLLETEKERVKMELGKEEVKEEIKPIKKRRIVRRVIYREASSSDSDNYNAST